MASRSGEELAKINCRERVDWVGSTGEFYYVIYNGQYGYVLKDFFSTDINADINYGSGSSSQNGSSSSNTLYCCASDYATLRSGASRSSEELDKIYSREQVTYLGESGEFYKVSFNGQTGYVLKDFFSYSADAPLNYGSGSE